MLTPSLRQLRQLCSLSVLATMLLLAGCGNSGSPDATSSSTSSSGIPFELGEPLSDTTLAVVVASEYDSDTLLTQEFDRQIQMRTQRLSPDQRSPDTLQAIHKNLVRRFVEGHMMRGKAVAEDFEVDSTRVSQRLSQIRKQYQSQDQLKKQLAQNNMTLDSLRSLIADRLRTQELQRQMAEQAQKPTSEEVKKFSKENMRIRAQHILLRAGKNASQAKVDSARKAAAALIDSTKAGTGFAALARRHSEGPSASKGGDLGFFTKDQMVDPFTEAAFALSDSGDVAPDPVRTRFGFHVIRLTNAGEPMDTSKARQQLMQKRQREAYDKELDKLLQDATVRTNPDIVNAKLSE
ncbi:MAG: peptidylprolyl isomerase [Bacteroidetes bacterium SW_9_63_38]|nr:MAG: peptidylprolyl isomerase [Bacteroidetes bacterium SW_9_63_38]